MRNLKQLGRSVALVALMMVTALAQNPVPLASVQNPVPPDVNILIQPRQVQFVAQKAIQEMRFQVFDEQGNLVYDSGTLTEPELKWNLHNGNGGELAGGLYAYKLTIKEQGKETAEEKRGHFIIERAAERKSDRLWVTSPTETGVGTDVRGSELTVAMSERGTVAGTRNAERKLDPTRDESVDKKVEKTSASATSAFNTTSSGTVNRIAKWVATDKIGDSVLFEVNGNVGIGTTNPFARLYVTTTTKNAGDNTATFSAPTIGANLSHIHYGTTGDWFIRSAANGGKVILQDTGGNVGIGTSTPSQKLFVNGGNTITRLGINSTFNAGVGLYLNNSLQWSLASVGTTGDFQIYEDDAGVNRFYISGGGANQGNVGIGTTTPNRKLTIRTENGTGLSHTNGVVEVGTFAGVQGGYVQTHSNHSLHFATNDSSPQMTLTTSGDLGIGTAVPQARLDVAGTTRTSVLQITGGADFAENFEINTVAEAGRNPAVGPLQPGLVVTIDPQTPGKLAVSTQAYDRKVAGIISGAGGVNPGMVMSQVGTLADGKHPVALTGRVYCWVDASNGSVMPGDLLTTSDTPGYAMKATDSAKAQGAIIGKAMTELKDGKGLVLVLVTLQ